MVKGRTRANNGIRGQTHLVIIKHGDLSTTHNLHVRDEAESSIQHTRNLNLNGLGEILDRHKALPWGKVHEGQVEHIQFTITKSPSEAHQVANPEKRGRGADRFQEALHLEAKWIMQQHRVHGEIKVLCEITESQGTKRGWYPGEGASMDE